MERQSTESRGLKAYCRGGQGPPQAVAPFGFGAFYIKECSYKNTILLPAIYTENKQCTGYAQKWEGQQKQLNFIAFYFIIKKCA
jgi:hypothetical protein